MAGKKNIFPKEVESTVGGLQINKVKLNDLNANDLFTMADSNPLFDFLP